MALAGEQLSFRSPSAGNTSGRLLGLRESSQALAELKTKLEFALSRLNDQDTQRTGVEEIREFLQALYPEWFPMVISCISEAGANLKPLGRCESVKLLGLLAELHGDLVVPLLQRILQVVVTRLQDADLHLREACAETVFRLARALVEDVEGSPVFATLLKPLFGALSEHNKWVQIGAAACICSVIQGSPPLVIRENLSRLCSRLVQHLSLPLAMAKPQLLSACIYAMQAVEGADFDEVLPGLMPCLESCLQASSDWQTRKQAIEVLQVIGDNPELGLSLELPLPTSSSARPTPLQRRIAMALEVVKADKVRAVREAAKECLLQWSITRSSGLLGNIVGPRSASPLPAAAAAAAEMRMAEQRVAEQRDQRGSTSARPMSPGPASNQWPPAAIEGPPAQSGPRGHEVQRESSNRDRARGGNDGESSSYRPPAESTAANRGHSRGVRSAPRERAEPYPDDTVFASARTDASVMSTPMRGTVCDLDDDDASARKAARDSAVRAALLGADLNGTKKPKPKRERVSIFNGPANSKFFGKKPSTQAGIDEGAESLAEERCASPRAESEDARAEDEDFPSSSAHIDDLPIRAGRRQDAESESNEDWGRESCDEALRAAPAWPEDEAEELPDAAALQSEASTASTARSRGSGPPLWGEQRLGLARKAAQGPMREAKALPRLEPEEEASQRPSHEASQRTSPSRRPSAKREQARGMRSARSPEGSRPMQVQEQPLGSGPVALGEAAEPEAAQEQGARPASTIAAQRRRLPVREAHQQVRPPAGAEAPSAEPAKADAGGGGSVPSSRRQEQPLKAPPPSPQAPSWPWEDAPLGKQREAAATERIEDPAPPAEPATATAAVPAPKAASAVPAASEASPQASEDVGFLITQLEVLSERLLFLEEDKKRMENDLGGRLKQAIQACASQNEALTAQREMTNSQEKRIQAQDQQLKAQEQRLQRQERQLQQQSEQLQELHDLLQQQEQQFEQQDQQLREHEQQLEQQEQQLEEHKAALEELVAVESEDQEPSGFDEPHMQRRGSNDSRSSAALHRDASDLQGGETGMNSGPTGGVHPGTGDRPNLGLGNGMLFEALGVKGCSPKKAVILWERITELCNEQRYLEAYKQAIAEPEESCLLRLMRHTGPIVERLDAESNSRLIRRLIHILSSPSKECAAASIEQIFAWLRQALASGIHFTASQVEDLAVALQRVALPQSALPVPARSEASQLLLQVASLRTRGA